MTNLTRFDNDGLEFFINTQTGECFASQRGLARMVGVSEGAIRKWAKSLLNTTVAQTDKKMVEALAQPHLETVAQADFKGAYQTDKKRAEALAQPHLEGAYQAGAKVSTDGGGQSALLFDEDAILEAIIKYKPELIKAFLNHESAKVSRKQVYIAVSQLEREGKLVYYAADDKIFPVHKQLHSPRITAHNRA